MRGVGNQTRLEIIRFINELRERFPNTEAAPEEILGVPTLESLHQRILGARSSKNESDWNLRCSLLGLSPNVNHSPTHWPSQTEVADASHVNPPRVYQTLAADRKRWNKDSPITALRNELCEEICRLGGIVTVGELIDLTILLRPASRTLDTARQQRLASAVARATVETEGSLAEPRFQLRRVSGKTVVACSAELAAYADKLGQVADDLAANDPLPPPMRVFQELYEVAQPPLPPGPPSCQPFSNERLLKLAAAMSKTAAVSSRQELYPRGMPADRTLRLGIGALSGLGLGDSEGGFTPDQVRARVESRYPEAERLPDHPELQRLLEAVGMEVRWDAETKKYHRPELVRTTSGSSQSQRLPTAQTARQQIEATPEMAKRGSSRIASSMPTPTAASLSSR